MAESRRNVWLVLIVVIALLLVGIGYYVTVYMNQPDEIIGVWNGTIKYGAYYYESRFNFTSNGYCNLTLHYKPSMTFNYTQITTPEIINMTVQWEKVNGSYDLLYPDGRVNLYYPDIPHTLRFNESKRDGYINPYIGYLSKNYQNLEDFSHS